MKPGNVRRAVVAALALSTAAMAGCVTPQRSLYYWGDYQPVVYSHFKGDAAEAQQVRLEKLAHEAQSRGQPVPPGFNAHLGLLHLNTGQLDQARAAFEAEAALFPESRPYMNFLLSKFAAQAVGAAR